MFMSYGLQRLHAISQKGVAQLSRALRPVPSGAAHIPTPSLRFGAPIRRPAGSALARMGPPLSSQPLWKTAAISRLSTRPVVVQPLAVPPALPLPLPLPWLLLLRCLKMSLPDRQAALSIV